MGDDHRLGKVLSEDRTVHHGEVHAAHPHLLFAFERIFGRAGSLLVLLGTLPCLAGASVETMVTARPLLA